ncbi:MAG: hypothetical protein IJJ23_08170 [Clostridia bacterium]|nr:hypothetical protein [Clostridia bacterium]
MYRYRNASYGGESVTLDNGLIRLDMHKRLCGWGWGEIYTPEGKMMAVIDHLGEMLARDQEIPMRLEAETYTRDDNDDELALVFDVKSVVVQDKLKNTSFDPWIHYAFGESCLRGQVRVSMPRHEPVIRMSMRYRSNINGYASYIRGPWLKVGQDEFGVKKDDAILPGVEWLVGDEWSSGSDWFKDPWALRVCPHPRKVTAPVMILSQGGDTISMSYDPKKMATGWFNNPRHVQQPVFASPNFIDRQNNTIFGLMIPAAIDDNHENLVRSPQFPVELHLDQMINFDCEIALGKGRSLDALTAWTAKKGLPTPSYDLETMKEDLHRIARLYNAKYWVEGAGFGVPQSRPGTPYAGPGYPRGLRAYLDMFPDSPESEPLRRKLDWCDEVRKAVSETPEQRADYYGRLPDTLAEAEQVGDVILSWQHGDGSFTFDPDGRHYTKDDFVVARSFIEPMGRAGDAALDICVLPAIKLMQLYERFGVKRFLTGAKKALDFCLDMTRPEGGDYWECPLHSPNLFAGGHAANAYAFAHRILKDEIYLGRARYWIRSFLGFTHLWEPEENSMLYNTKPCLCSSDWYFANWVRDHVQWEVLDSFAQAEELGLDWAELDPAIDWRTFQQGVTAAALRWSKQAQGGKWLPHNLPWTYDEYVKGSFEGCFPDTHNSVTGLYGGAFIMPAQIVNNIVSLLRKQEK